MKENKEFSLKLVFVFVLNSLVSISSLVLAFTNMVLDRLTNQKIINTSIIVTAIIALILVSTMIGLVVYEYQKSKKKFGPVHLEV